MAARYLNLKIDGKFVKDIILQHVSVTQGLNDHWWCHAECRHTQDQRTSGPPPSAAEERAAEESAITVEEWLGKEIQVIEMGDGEIPLFRGFVLEVELIYELSGSFTAILQGVTESFKMDVAPRLAYYQEMSLASIANQLAGQAGLKATVTCQDRRPLNYVQWHESDFQFLHRLADDHGCWMRPCEGGIEIYDSFLQENTVHWRKESGENALRGFSIKGTLAPPSFDGVHYDFHQMKSETYKNISKEPQFFESIAPLVNAVKEGSTKNLPSNYLDHRSRAVTLSEYKELLEKESVRSIGRSITGSGESINIELRPGNQVTIEGPLDASGTYGITHVTHTWDPPNGYTNQFTCTPWKNYTDSHPPQLRPWFGAVPARVVEHNDPKKMGRVKVQYFWQEEGPAHWARMMTPHAGSDRGFMFMPEVGDEVVVIFEDGDPERPVVLGCVWNAVDVAPRGEFRAGDIAPNEVKRIVTKSGNRLQFVDTKGKESIVLSTPNSVKVSLIAANGSPTGRETLLLQSEHGDIILNAPEGRIHLHSKRHSREIG
jgi:type VI secretion system secreted protein VgrG